MDVDALDLQLIEELVRHPKATYKDLGKAFHVDQRTVANRLSRLRKEGVISEAIDVAWEKLGLKAVAYVGCTTATGEKRVAELEKFIRADPRIIEAYETVGSHQYLMLVLERDLPTLRDTILRDLEPLTADLSTSLLILPVKGRSLLPAIEFLRLSKFPRSSAAPTGTSAS
jgi:Lrp/AsnC family transcriptional regulator, leucine-responsive regulatory protein